MIKRSRVVIVVCQELETTVRAIREDVPTVLIENAPGAGDPSARRDGATIRAALGLARSTPVILYTGTFESYQGLDLLYSAMKTVLASKPEARLVLVGGDAAQVAAARKHVAAVGISDAVVFTGQRPPEEIPSYLDAATVLVSPRSSGTNTPLKIYQYLRSGRPIVATNLRTHTQVLSSDTAFLADPTPAMFADALLAALNDPERAGRVGEAARRLAETRYSDAAYLAKTKEAFALLVHPARGEVERGVA
jgi:glycosyltransferase involved in cell wall biosynthesis